MISQTVKRCTKCHLELPREDFYKNKAKADGLASRCKSCSDWYSWRTRQKNKTRNIVTPPTGNYMCRTCEEVLPCTMFYKNRSSTIGIRYDCKACRMRKSKEYNHSNLGRAAWRKRTYNLSDTHFQALLNLQNGMCAICESTTSGNTSQGVLSVDHCHVTKRVRGLVCHTCNSLLGHAKHRPDLLEVAAQYLRNPPADRLSS